MYTKKDLDSVRQQLKKRRMLIWTAAAVPAALLLVNLLFIHIPLLTYVTFLLSGFILVFGLDFVVKPVKKYAVYLDLALNGRTRETDDLFLSFDENPVIREGVRVYPVMLSVGNPKDEKDDRLYYYDVLAERPEWHTEEMLHITYHDKFIVNWSRPAKKSE